MVLLPFKVVPGQHPMPRGGALAKAFATFSCVLTRPSTLASLFSTSSLSFLRAAPNPSICFCRFCSSCLMYPRRLALSALSAASPARRSSTLSLLSSAPAAPPKHKKALNRHIAHPREPLICALLLIP